MRLMESVTTKEVIVAAKVFTFAGLNFNEKFKVEAIMSNETMGWIFVGGDSILLLMTLILCFLDYKIAQNKSVDNH